MRRFIFPLLIALSTGCLGRATVSGGYAAGYDGNISYVEVNPGVYAIADYDQPVFYADNFYWRFDSGRWYRSSYYNRGWAYAQPPTVVARIENPHRYVHYRPTVRDRVVVRDHRSGRFIRR